MFVCFLFFVCETPHVQMEKLRLGEVKWLTQATFQEHDKDYIVLIKEVEDLRSCYLNKQKLSLKANK